MHRRAAYAGTQGFGGTAHFKVQWSGGAAHGQARGSTSAAHGKAQGPRGGAHGEAQGSRGSTYGRTQGRKNDAEHTGQYSRRAIAATLANRLEKKIASIRAQPLKAALPELALSL